MIATTLLHSLQGRSKMMMRAFSLQKLRVISYHFSSDFHNIRKTSFSRNPIFSSRNLHDAPLVEKLHDDASTRQEEQRIERKQLWISREDTIEEQQRFQFLLENLGLTTLVRMIHMIHVHGSSIGLTGFNRLVKLLIEKAMSTGDKCILLEQLNLIRHLLQSMPVQLELELEEETYGPLLKYIIDMGAVDEFKFFCKLIKDHNHNSISRLGYYDMLMWIRVNDEAKIRDACEYITIKDSENTTPDLQENYLLALCESERKEQISDVLENADIVVFGSSIFISNIFKSLGRLQLKSEAEELLYDNYDDCNVEEISDFIAIYAFSIPNLEVEHIIKEIENWHDLMNISPSSSTYEKLILYSCGKNKVDAAIYVVDEMCGYRLMPSSHLIQSVLETCSETNLDFQVGQIYSILSRRHRLHSFMLTRMNFQDNWLSLHFGTVIKDYYEEMQQSGIHFSKEVFVALIHAYAAYGEFEKAKQIVLDPRIPVKWLIEIKSMLVSSLASHGKLSEALVLLEEIRKAGQTLNPKAVLCLMDVLCNLHGGLERSLLLLTELSGEDWVHGCKIVIKFSIQNKNLSSTIEMLKQLVDYFKHDENKSDSLDSDEVKIEILCNEVYHSILVYGSTHLQFGLDLLDLIKKELGLPLCCFGNPKKFILGFSEGGTVLDQICSGTGKCRVFLNWRLERKYADAL